MSHPAYGVLRPVTPLASVLLARNPSPMTLDGTNTWVLRAPGSRGVRGRRPGRGRRATTWSGWPRTGPSRWCCSPTATTTTPGGARRFAELTGAPVRALDPSLVLGSEALADGDVVAAAGVELRVVGTPGHTSDSLSFLLDGPDAEPGRAHRRHHPRPRHHRDRAPGRRARAVPRLAAPARRARRRARRCCRATGRSCADAPAVVAGYLAHREQRLDQVRAALGDARAGRVGAGRWWSWSTPTSTRSSGPRRSSRCWPSWSTCAAECQAAARVAPADPQHHGQHHAGEPARQERRRRAGRLHDDPGRRLPGGEPERRGGDHPAERLGRRALGRRDVDGQRVRGDLRRDERTRPRASPRRAARTTGAARRAPSRPPAPERPEQHGHPQVQRARPRPHAVEHPGQHRGHRPGRQQQAARWRANRPPP